MVYTPQSHALGQSTRLAKEHDPFGGRDGTAAEDVAGLVILRDFEMLSEDCQP